MMTEYPRLHVDQDDPPAPIPIREHMRRTSDDEETRDDSIEMAERALKRAQSALDELDRLTDEAFAPFKFRPTDDDDGPRAA